MNHTRPLPFPEGGLRQHAMRRAIEAMYVLLAGACVVAAAYTLHAASQTDYVIVIIGCWVLVALLAGAEALLCVRLGARLVTGLRSRS